MASKARCRNRSRGLGDSEHVKKRRRGLKQQIRDTKRLLAKPDLPETVRQVKERVLKMMVDELQDKERIIHDRKINKKYKMIKFFEKRKVVRKLRSHLRLLSSLQDQDPQRKEITSQVHQLRADLNYIVHYPSGEKYVALFPTSSETGQKALAVRDEIYKSIQTQVRDETLTDAVAMEFDSKTASLVPETEDGKVPTVEGSSRMFDKRSTVAQDDGKATSTEFTGVLSDGEDCATLLNLSDLRAESPVNESGKESKQPCLSTDGQATSRSITNKKTRVVPSTQAIKRRTVNSKDCEFLLGRESSLRKPKSKRRRVLAACDDEGPISFKIQDDPFFI